MQERVPGRTERGLTTKRGLQKAPHLPDRRPDERSADLEYRDVLPLTPRPEQRLAVHRPRDPYVENVRDRREDVDGAHGSVVDPTVALGGVLDEERHGGD